MEISPKKNRLIVQKQIMAATQKSFRTYDDPIREKIGSAYDSHPKETESIIDYLQSVNVEIKYRHNTMAYLPSPKEGHPGMFIIDPEASYSAWLHEKTHVEDDEKSGWKGMRLLCDTAERLKMEEKAYDVELDFARGYGYNDVVERLQRLKEESLLEIMRGEA